MSRVKAAATLLAGLDMAPAGGAIAFQYGKAAGWRRWLAAPAEWERRVVSFFEAALM